MSAGLAVQVSPSCGACKALAPSHHREHEHTKPPFSLALNRCSEGCVSKCSCWDSNAESGARFGVFFPPLCTALLAKNYLFTLDISDFYFSIMHFTPCRASQPSPSYASLQGRNLTLFFWLHSYCIVLTWLHKETLDHPGSCFQVEGY